MHPINYEQLKADLRNLLKQSEQPMHIRDTIAASLEAIEDLERQLDDARDRLADRHA